MRPLPEPQHPSTPAPLALPLTSCRADTFIQRTKKLYVDTRTQRNLNKLNDVSHRPQPRRHPSQPRRCAATSPPHPRAV